MKLIVGLGNPGEEYVKTRHNVGFMVVDEIVLRKSYDPWQNKTKLKSQIINLRNLVVLAKPQTMMNNSGDAVSSLCAYYKLQAMDIYVIHDDLDIRLGEYKIQKGKGPKDHGGLNSIYEKLGTKDFWHVRVGIENRSSKIQNPNDKTQKISGEEYVLQDFKDDELKELKPVIAKIVDELVSLISNN